MFPAGFTPYSKGTGLGAVARQDWDLGGHAGRGVGIALHSGEKHEGSSLFPLNLSLRAKVLVSEGSDQGSRDKPNSSVEKQSHKAKI